MQVSNDPINCDGTVLYCEVRRGGRLAASGLSSSICISWKGVNVAVALLTMLEMKFAIRST